MAALALSPLAAQQPTAGCTLQFLHECFQCFIGVASLCAASFACRPCRLCPLPGLTRAPTRHSPPAETEAQADEGDVRTAKLSDLLARMEKQGLHG